MNCHACGTPADPDARFCEACGAALTSPSPDPRLVAPAMEDHCELDLGADLAAVSDRGRVHAHNEDAVAVSRDTIDGRAIAILVVCDGVSSSHDPARGSAMAARVAADALLEGARNRRDPDQLMRAAILDAHAAVAALVPASAGEERPLTTIVAALVDQTIVTVGWAGDSRAYVLGTASRALTRDDSWCNWAIERGLVTQIEALYSPNAHVIVQCLGDPTDVPVPHIVRTAMATGDRLLLCSDGLWNYAPESHDLARILAGSAGGPTIEACRALIAFANGAGGRDNITAALLAVPRDTSSLAPPDKARSITGRDA
jgi:PPM family protein phosphatase